MSYRRSKRYPELFRKRATGPWWAFLPNPQGGRKLRESTGHRDEQPAHEWYLERLRSPNGQTVETAPAKKRSLRDALAGRIEWLRAARKHDDPTRKKLAASTIEFYDKHSTPLVAVLGRDTPLSAIGHEEIRRYIVTRSETVKGTTISKELTALSCAMRLARKDGVACPVFADIVPEDFATRYVPKTRWLTEKEVEAYLTVLAPKRMPLFLFLVCTGATYPSEVHGKIKPESIKGHVVHVPGTKATTRDRFVHVPSYARAFFKRTVKDLGPSGFESWTNVRGDLHNGARLLSMCAACRDKARRQGGRLSAIEAGHETTVRLIQDLRAKGHTYDRIANELTAQGVETVRGGNWFKASVRKLALASLEKRLTQDVDCAACKATKRFLPCSPNDLRRTFAQWLVRSGVPYELAAPMMGHNSTKMLEQVYGKRNAAAVAALVEIALKKAPKGARAA